MDGLYEDQLDGFYSIAQQLLISNLSNKDYAAILLEYANDVDKVQENIIDEGGEKNVNAWLSDSYRISLKNV